MRDDITCTPLVIPLKNGLNPDKYECYAFEIPFQEKSVESFLECQVCLVVSNFEHI